jgi:hypothetical protein
MMTKEAFLKDTAFIKALSKKVTFHKQAPRVWKGLTLSPEGHNSRLTCVLSVRKRDRKEETK